MSVMILEVKFFSTKMKFIFSVNLHYLLHETGVVSHGML